MLRERAVRGAVFIVGMLRNAAECVIRCLNAGERPFINTLFQERKDSKIVKLKHRYNKLTGKTDDTLEEQERKIKCQTITGYIANAKSLDEKIALATIITILGNNGEMTAEEVQDARNKIAETITNPQEKREFIKGVISDENNSLTGAKMSKEEAERLWFNDDLQKSPEELEAEFNQLSADWNAFYNENKELVDTVNEKIKNGCQKEELTDSEHAVYNIMQRNSSKLSPKTAATAANPHFGDNEDKRRELLEKGLTLGEQSNPNIIEDVARILNDNKDQIDMPSEKITTVLDEVTDNKYSEAVKNLNLNENKSDISSQENSTNNTTSIGFAQKENVNNNTNVNNNNTEVAHTASVIDTPVQTESTSNSSVALGFTATAPKVDTTRLDSISQTITAQTTEAIRAESQAEEEIVVTKTTSFIKALQLGKEGVDKFFAENGTIKAVTAVFNNFSQISDQTIITKALQLYKGLSSTEQADILVSAKNGALVELINNSDINALAQCQGETASNFWATKKINEAAEKALEKQA